MKISKENARIEFEKIVDCFGFYVPEAVKTQKIETEIGGMTVSLQQDMEQAAVFIQKIQEGKIEFDEKEEKIIYNLRKPIMFNEKNISQFHFGEFIMGRLKQSGIDIKDCNVANMKTEQREKVLMAMTGVESEKVFEKIAPVVFNDLWTIAGYFFS